MDKTVNVGIIGHGFHGGMAILIGTGHVNTMAPIPPERGISVSTRVGKGQRKANKANRWR